MVALFRYNILPIQQRLDRVLQTNSTVPSSSTFSRIGPNKFCITQAAVDELRVVLEGLEAKKHHKAETFRNALEWIGKECIVLKNNSETNNKEEATTENSNSLSVPHSTTPAQQEMLHHIQKGEKLYIVASQDEKLLGELRNKGTSPIVRLADNSVLILENPSKQSQRHALGMERQKWSNQLPEAERALVDLVKKEVRQSENTKENNTLQQQQRRRQIERDFGGGGGGIPPQVFSSTRKRSSGKAKGPNPLSCKRKAKSSSSDDAKKESASRKRRRRATKESSSKGL